MKIQQELSDKGFSIIGMSLDSSSRPVQRFIRDWKINYPVLMAERKTVDDFGGIIGVPTSFLVNRNGIIIKRYLGYIDKNTLRRDVEGILNDPSQKTTSTTAPESAK